MIRCIPMYGCFTAHGLEDERVSNARSLAAVHRIENRRERFGLEQKCAAMWRAGERRQIERIVLDKNTFFWQNYDMAGEICFRFNLETKVY